MDESKRAAEWCRWFTAAQDSYKFNAMEAVLVNDGPQMMLKVLKELKINSALELVEKCSCSK